MILWGEVPYPAIEPLDPVMGEKLTVFQANDSVTWTAASTGVFWPTAQILSAFRAFRYR